MSKWITLDEVKEDLRYDDDDHDDRLQRHIDFAEASISSYITTQPETPEQIEIVRRATLLLTKIYEDPDNNPTPHLDNFGYPPAAVVATLTPLRKPTVI